jgi:hypothetical protein
MERIIFFDLEVKRNTNRIQDIGAIFNGEEFHGTSVLQFSQFLGKSGLYRMNSGLQKTNIEIRRYN